MKLISVDSIALGAFNPHIPQPGWYISLGLLDPNPGVVSKEVGLHEPALRCTVGNLRWVVTLDRFAVDLVKLNSDAEVAQPAEFLANTLQKLCHTPLSAVGHNFGFMLTSPGCKFVQSMLATLDLLRETLDAPSHTSFMQVTLDREVGGARATLRLQLDPDRTVVSVNMNRIVGSAEEGVVAARSVQADFEWATRALRRIVNAGEHS